MGVPAQPRQPAPWRRRAFRRYAIPPPAYKPCLAWRDPPHTAATASPPCPPGAAASRCRRCSVRAAPPGPAAAPGGPALRPMRRLPAGLPGGSPGRGEGGCEQVPAGAGGRAAGAPEPVAPAGQQPAGLRPVPAGMPPGPGRGESRCPRNWPALVCPVAGGPGAALVPWIGANYARKKRIQARACLIAANLGRTDCLPLLGPLTQDRTRRFYLHARWAIQSLTAREARSPERACRTGKRPRPSIGRAGCPLPGKGGSPVEGNW